MSQRQRQVSPEKLRKKKDLDVHNQSFNKYNFRKSWQKTTIDVERLES